jgi:glucose/arabinose dehydrogenase/PKD repeat protein
MLSYRRLLTCRWILLLGALLGGFTTKGASFPAGFIGESIAGIWTEAVGLTFDANGRMYVWEKAGRVWIVENGVRQPVPLLDISEEVGNWRDHGLLGLALHPDFLNNGYIYLLYVADYHHVAQFGTPNYVPGANQYFRATIGRVTRYTARSADGLRTADPTSRLVLLGESVTNGLPILDITHSVGSIMFGADGTLLVSCGDGAFFTGAGSGVLNSTFYRTQALADGIITPEEDVDAFRAQMVDSLAGKILRIDPSNGDGVAGNPYFNPALPRAARSRVWSLGFRNPFRMSLRPGTGSHDRADANPGVIYIGEVGWDNWEELDVSTGPANFGWPLYEGLEPVPVYQASGIQNRLAVNPLHGAGSCDQPFFQFRDLLQPDSTNLTVSFPNPCDVTQQIPASIPQFRHTRPVLDWGRNSYGPSRTGIYDENGHPVAIDIGTVGSPVTGPAFSGNCAIGGVWHTGAAFPALYANTYFMADYGAGWVKSIVFDGNNKPTRVQDFIGNEPHIVCLAVNPKDGSLYYIANLTNVVKVSYIGGGNKPPLAVATVNKRFGASPLTVQFTGSGSSDPEGQPLSYSWNFGDGSGLVTTANPIHTFTTPNGSPKSYEVNLTVTDSASATARTTVIISANNTPPTVVITSPTNGDLYSMTEASVYNLTAAVSDAESTAGELRYAWEVFLHHNEHQHAEPVVTTASATAVISPAGCDGNTYYYQIRLTVTDAQGLSSSAEVNLYPECGLPAPPDNLVANALSCTRIQLTWADESADETGFHIQRSQNGGPFLNIGTVGADVTTFVSSGLSVATTYSYRVAAFSLVGQSPYSNVATATSQDMLPVPPPWANMDVANTGPAGSAGFDEGTFIVRCSGPDINGSLDGFQFVYRAWTGNGALITKVTGIENTDTWAKAGLMFRQSLAADSVNAMILVRPLNGVVFQYRSVMGGGTVFGDSYEVAAPVWLKIERLGNHFTGYVSLDGMDWLLIGSQTVSMSDTIYVGLAVSSHDSLVLNTSTFANLQMITPLIPAMSLSKRTDGALELSITGQIGASYLTEASTNLTVWVPISTNVNSSGTIKLSDAEMQNFTQRFYRAFLVP